MKTKREETRRKIIMSLLDGQERMQQEIASKVGEGEDYISPIIKGLEQEDIIKREVRKSPKTYEDRKKGGEVTKDYSVKFCCLDASPETFRLLVKEFIRSDERFDFLYSEYAQKMLTIDFLNSCATTFWKKYGKQIKRILEEVKSSKDIKFIAPWLESLASSLEKRLKLREEIITLDLSKIIKRSPLAIYLLMFPDEAMKEAVPFFEKTDWIFSETLKISRGLMQQIEEQMMG